MSFIDTVRQTVYGRVLSVWAAAGTPPTPLVTPVAFETADKTIGLLTISDGSASIPRPPATAPWMRCTIRLGTGMQKDIGPAPRVRQVGRIFLDLFAPIDNARPVLDPLVDQALALFDRKQLPPLHCQASFAIEQGQDGQWWWSQVTTPFYVERLST